MDTLKTYWTQIQSSLPEIGHIATQFLSSFGILVIGWIIARWVRKKIRTTAFGGRAIDRTIRPVIAGTAFYVLIAMSIYAALRHMGIEATALLAVFGAAGLAIGLALKDTLGNIAAGFMLLVLHPFKVDDFIITPTVSGTVSEIGLFQTQIRTLEGVLVFVPNAEIWHQNIQNYNRHSHRRLIVDVGIGYESDLTKARDLVLETLNADPNVLGGDKAPECYVMQFADSAVILSCRCWLPGDNWLGNTSDIRIALKTALDKAGIEIPFPQRVMHTKN